MVDLPITGYELKQLRALFKIPARKIGEVLEDGGLMPTTTRGIYYLEERSVVPLPVSTHLSWYIGDKAFTQAITLIRKQAEIKQHRSKEYAEKAKIARKQREEEAEQEHHEQTEANLHLITELTRKLEQEAEGLDAA